MGSKSIGNEEIEKKSRKSKEKEEKNALDWIESGENRCEHVRCVLMANRLERTGK